jgi:hypothetical protein
MFKLYNSQSQITVVTTDIIKKFKDPWSEVQPASIERKFERFFNNNKFMSYESRHFLCS